MTKAAGIKVSSKIRLTAADDLNNEDDEVSEANLTENGSGQAAVINYKDASGTPSTRLITILAVSGSEKLQTVKAFCHAKAGYRTFRLDRISDVFDVITGERLAEPFIFFRALSKASFSHAKDWNVDDHLTEDLASLLVILTYLARCDGTFHPKEEEAVEDALTIFCLRKEARLEPNAERVAHHAARLAPSAANFDEALRKVARDKVLTQVVRRSAGLLIDADGVHAREEFDVAAEIDRVLRG